MTARGTRGLAFGLVLLLAFLAVPGVGAESAMPACDPWLLTPTPPDPAGPLWGVAGTSSSDVWAVGGELATPAPIIQHWNGVSWSAASQIPTKSILYGVSATSPTDVWAAGYLYNGGNTKPIVYHWDGAVWSPVRVPAPGNYRFLNDVAAISSTDVWAIGDYTGGDGIIHGLAEHWDGTVWSVVPFPDADRFSNVPEALEAIATDDIWAVGYHVPNGDFVAQPLVEHWDGTVWRVVASAPLPPNSTGNLLGVSGTSSSDVWAVGLLGVNSEAPGLVEHWDGTAWHRTPIPTVSGGLALWGVAAVAANDGWIVGGRLPPTGSGGRAASLHWDGTAWTSLETPHPFNSSLVSVTPISATDVWAVGSYGQVLVPLAMHAAGPCPA